MKRLVLIPLTALVASAALAASAHAGFGLEDLTLESLADDGSAVVEAGTHPATIETTINVSTRIDPVMGEIPEDAVKNIRFSMPAGLVGDPHAVPPCSTEDFTDIYDSKSACANSSVVGYVDLRIGYEKPESFLAPLYNIEPPSGAPAALGFVVVGGVPVVLDVALNPNPPHNLIVTASNVPQAVRFYGSDVTIWGNPASSAHDDLRGECIGPADDRCPVSIPERPFLTMPRSCSGPLPVEVTMNSWENPADWVRYETAIEPGMTGCSALDFFPAVGARLGTTMAESSTGLGFDIKVADGGLTAPRGRAQSDIRRATVTMPEGITVNPSAASGLSGCSQADLAAESVTSYPGQGCPEASKVGELEVETPLLEGEVLHGSVYVAAPRANPFGSLLALYMVIKDRDLGIVVKLAGRVELDQSSGRLVTTFGDAGHEIPQFPFSHFRFRFREGPRAPLVTPPGCGSYAINTVLEPWSGGSALSTDAVFGINQGPGGAGCPAAPRPFDPGFQGGTIDNTGGAHTPFYMRVTRRDGERDLSRVSALLPRGLHGKVAGVPTCSDAAIAAAAHVTGSTELQSPSCPAGSRIGHVEAGAGLGGVLTWVKGQIYLAGPYAGHPLSVVVITPAVAGPFDLGTVVIRQGLDLDPLSGEVLVDGAVATPIPRMIEGVPLKLRDLRIHIDKPGFMLNPTSCDPMAIRASLTGAGVNPVDAAEVVVERQDRFQAASCLNMGFRPKLSLSLKGPTRRGGHPALTAVLTSRPGDANIAGASVLLPRTEMIDQSRIGQVCTRAQFAAAACPASSVLGRARAITPLLDSPLAGRVYLRANGGERELPDMVVDLRGQFRVILVGYIDARNARIRTRFQRLPDAQVSKFVLRLNSGKRGLLQHNTNICHRKMRLGLTLTAQNGRRLKSKPRIGTSCRSKTKRSTQAKKKEN